MLVSSVFALANQQMEKKNIVNYKRCKIDYKTTIKKSTTGNSILCIH